VAENLVKLRYRIIKRKYKLETYPHPELRLNIPVRLHDLFKFLWNCKVTLEVKREGDSIVIIMRKDQDS
jgi:hypothetical protein